VTVPFRLVRDALARLSLEPKAQRDALAGSVVSDELALDLDNAVSSLRYESQRTGIVLPGPFIAALRDLNDRLDAPPGDSLWDDAALETHPTWDAARRNARVLLAQLPPTSDEDISGG
jgi:hypothetical protein